RSVLVHGGGRHVDRMLRAAGVESRFVGGRRATSPASMEVVEMVLSGMVNKDLAAGLTRAGLPPIGISGRDGAMIRARLEPDLGRVGVPVEVDPAPVRALWDAGLLPVVSPVSCGPSGESVNVNAVEAVLVLRRGHGAAALAYFSGVGGVGGGEEARVTDADGRSYLDFAAGIGVNGLGYGDRGVVAAIRKQAGKLIHASNLYYSQPTQALADRLAGLAFPSKVFFCNSGTEAVEAAMKFARRIGGPAGRTEFVAFERRFHGRTRGAAPRT